VRAFTCALALVLALAIPAHAADKLAVLEEKAQAGAPDRAGRERWRRKLRALVGKAPPAIVNVWNTWTRETLVLDAHIDRETFGKFLRCHFTGQPAPMDMRLLGVLVAAARKFNPPRIEIVSGFRAPKYNLMLRKKGREVARDSQHTVGSAVDFRLRGVPAAQLLAFVKSLRLGGAGVYTGSNFVHADTGPVRYWAGR
jgi:hypothetical protein